MLDSYLSLSRTVSLTTLCFLLYGICLAIYRLFFHPLARFPGPKLAALTKWYEFVFDILRGGGGTFMYEIDRMHARYGPIVRINPDELHVDDPEWYDVLYAGPGSVRDKYPPAAAMAGVTLGTSGTILHSVHRKRRAAISPWFSKQSITATEDFIVAQAELLYDTLQDQLQNNQVAELRVNFSAFTTDVVCGYVFGGSMGLLQHTTRAAEWKRTISAVAALTPLIKQFPWIIPAVKKLPTSLLDAVVPDLTRIVKLHKDMQQRAATVIKDWEPQHDLPRTHTKSSTPVAETRYPTIFHEILSTNLPPAEKTAKRMGEEGFVIIAAGGETTGRTLAAATYYLLSDKEACAKLKAELNAAMPDEKNVPKLRELEQLPWLTAVIKESLRLSALVTSRLPQISPNSDLQFQDWVIPSGIPMGMTIHTTLMNPHTYPKPCDFLPQRWIDADSKELEQMNRLYVPFGRGSRMCLGLSLAYAEMYICLAMLFRRFDLQLHETYRERDVDLVRDCFVGETRKESPGVRVVLGGKE